MGKMVFLIILAILQFVKFTKSVNLVVPVEGQPQKKRNININLEVNLGIGGNCTAADIVLGNCTNYPNGTTLKPMFLTPLKPQTTEKRKFEKIGEYIKMKLCSYGFDDARSCHVFCTMLGYVRYACSDLTLCHCWNKPGQVRQTLKAPTKKAEPANNAGTMQAVLPTQGVLVWVHQCRASSDCARYCTSKNYNGQECTDDETCHCFDLKPHQPIGSVKCTVFDGLDRSCLDHCHAENFDSSRCLKDGTCECYNEEAEIQHVKNKEQHIHVPDCADSNLGQCEAVCHLLKFQKFECSDKHNCHCFNNTVPVKTSTNASLEHLMIGEYIKLDCTWEHNGGFCKKRCSEKGYEIFECIRKDTCHCYDEPDDGDIGRGQRIIPGNRMLVANSSLSENSVANSTVIKDYKNLGNSANQPQPYKPNVLEENNANIPRKETLSHGGGTRSTHPSYHYHSSKNTTTHSTNSTKTTGTTTKGAALTPTNHNMTAKRIQVASGTRKSILSSKTWNKIRELTAKS